MKVYDDYLLSKCDKESMFDSSATLRNVLELLEPFNINQIHINDMLVYSRTRVCSGCADMLYDILGTYTCVKNNRIFVVSHIQITPEYGDEARVYIEGDWQDYGN